MRHFPNGAGEGLARAVTLLQSGVWEKEVEGLELLASLAQQHPEVPRVHHRIRINKDGKAKVVAAGWGDILECRTNH